MKHNIQKVNQNRTAWIDIARGIAILSVVIGHVNIIGVSQIGLGFQLPLFAILSGVLWKDSETFFPFIQKKACRLLTPYLIAGIISLAMWSLIHASNPFFSQYAFDFSTTIRPLLLGLNPLYNAPLWFLPSFLLAEILVKIIKPKIIWVILCFTIGIVIQRLVPNPLALPYAIDLAFLLASCIMIGKRAAPYLVAHRYHFPVMAASLIVFLITYYLNGTVNFYGREFHSLALFFLSNMSGSLFIILLSQSLESVAGKLALLGRASLFILVAHWPALLLLNFALEKVGFFTWTGATHYLVSISFPPGHTPILLILKLTSFLFYCAWGIGVPLALSRLRQATE